MIENKVFENLIKITANGSETEGKEILNESESLEFIKIKKVDEENLPQLVKDLEKLIGKLDETLVKIYRSEVGP
jgi:rRNA processing protein Krr1/Pno1